MLTEKECKEALDWLYSLAVPCREEVHEHRSSFLGEKYNLIKQLINEHFSNPPLKFEELKERETYYHVYYGWISIRSISDCECILINTLNSDGYKQIEFEEDCFYRKQVQE